QFWGRAAWRPAACPQDARFFAHGKARAIHKAGRSWDPPAWLGQRENNMPAKPRSTGQTYSTTTTKDHKIPLRKTDSFEIAPARAPPTALRPARTSKA